MTSKADRTSGTLIYSQKQKITTEPCPDRSTSILSFSEQQSEAQSVKNAAIRQRWLQFNKANDRELSQHRNDIWMGRLQRMWNKVYPHTNVYQQNKVSLATHSISYSPHS